MYELRKQKDFSQEELANRLNVSRQTVSKWEVGESTPDMEKLVAISDLFGVSLDELVMDKAPEKAEPSVQVVKSLFVEVSGCFTKSGVVKLLSLAKLRALF